LRDRIAIPAQITAGLSFTAALAVPDRPAPAWNITLHLRGPSQINMTAAPDGTGHLFSEPAVTTTDWAPGTYWWTLRATDGHDTLELATGDIAVVADLVNAPAGYDGRSDNEKALEAIEAVLGKRATMDQERYRINNRELYRTPIADLIKLRDFYAKRVARDKRKASGRSSSWGRPVRVQFS